MRYISFFIIFAGLFFIDQPSLAADSSKAKNIKLAGYRVIRASPTDFRNALWMNESNLKGPAKSRLAQFVKIKNKSIHKDFISFQVMPNISLLEDNSDFNQLTEFVISGQPTTNKEYRLDIKIIRKGIKDFVKGYIDVAPHEQGSLLAFFIEDSTYSDFTLNMLIKTFQLIRLTSPDKEEASAQSMKETAKVN